MGENIYLRKCFWQGEQRIDIRAFELKNGFFLPTKRGVSLKTEQYDILREHFGIIKEYLAKMQSGVDTNLRIDLGGDYAATINSPYQGLNIRHWFTKECIPLPGRGVFIKSPLYYRLVDFDHDLQNK